MSGPAISFTLTEAQCIWALANVTEDRSLEEHAELRRLAEWLDAHDPSGGYYVMATDEEWKPETDPEAVKARYGDDAD